MGFPVVFYGMNQVAGVSRSGLARLLWEQKVEGSIPSTPTIFACSGGRA